MGSGPLELNAGDVLRYAQPPRLPTSGLLLVISSSAYTDGLETSARRDEVIRRLRSHESDLRRLGMRSLRLFGSVARDEASESSDVDLLVGFEGPPTFSGFMALKIFVEDLLGARVDLITETGLREGVRPQVEREAIRVA